MNTQAHTYTDTSTHTHVHAVADVVVGIVVLAIYYLKRQSNVLNGHQFTFLAFKAIVIHTTYDFLLQMVVEKK